MGLDGAWSFHPYLAARLRTRGFELEPTPPRRRRRRWRRRGRVTFLRALASMVVLLVR